MTAPELKPHQIPRTTLPRRANTIREVAVDMARQVGIRQAISDRVGYLLAFLFGAAVMRYLGFWVVSAATAVYVLSVYIAYKRFLRERR